MYNSILSRIVLFSISMVLTKNIIIAQAEQNIIPPSPEASSFLRYGEIPIFTITEGDIKAPISISYHASGIKAMDIASEVGLGWVLNTGGLLVRIDFSKPDGFYGEPYYKTVTEFYDAVNSVSTEAERDEIGTKIEYMLDHQDLMSDRSYYSVGGFSGVFRTDFETGEIVSIPYNPVSYDFINGVITDENGTIYDFGPKGGYQDVNYLKSITSANSVDEINFVYKSWTGGYGYKTRSSILDLGNEWILNEYGELIETYSVHSDNLHKNNLYTGYEATYDSIYSRNTVVKFDYNFDNSQYKKYTINKISIYSRVPRKKIKEVVFHQSYFDKTYGADPNNYRLRLDSLSVYGSNPTLDPQTYSFKYKDGLNFPCPKVRKRWAGNTQRIFGGIIMGKMEIHMFQRRCYQVTDRPMVAHDILILF